MKGSLMEIEIIGKVGVTSFSARFCPGNEEDLLITETGLLCCACGEEQPHYTDQEEDDWSVVEYGLFADC
jgi:hypothetical protein